MSEFDATDPDNLPLLGIHVRAEWYRAQAFPGQSDQILASLSEQIRILAKTVESQLKARIAAADETVAASEHQANRALARAERQLAEGLAGIATEVIGESFDPHGCFVYLLWGRDDQKPLYVGKSTNVLARLGTHMSTPEKRAKTTRTMLIRCASEQQMDATERRLIAKYQPPMNTQGIFPVDQHPEEI